MSKSRNKYNRLKTTDAGDYYTDPETNYDAYPQQQQQQDPQPLFGSRRIKYGDILMFINTILLAVIVIVILLAVFVISSHHGELSKLGLRMATVEELARNVNDATQVLRRALGTPDTPVDGDSGTQNLLRHHDDNKHKGPSRWLRERQPDEEAAITDKAADAIVGVIRTVLRLMDQMDTNKVFEVVARTVDHADKVISSPDTNLLLHAAAVAADNPMTQLVFTQGMDMIAHMQGVALPLVDAVAMELKDQLQALMESGDQALTKANFQAMIRDLMQGISNVGSGLSQFVLWYRTGGPSDAAILASELVATSRALIESPAAISLIEVLEHIDWSDTGASLKSAAHNGAAVLQAINQAGSIEATDRLVRALASVLEDPNTKKALALLPAIAANATALMAKPSAQALIEQSSRLMSRVDDVLGEAEQARTVERAAEFLGTLRSVLGALVLGGLHVELGQPGTSNYVDQNVLQRDPTQSVAGAATAPIMAGMPRITGVRPEHLRKPQQQLRKRLHTRKQV